MPEIFNNNNETIYTLFEQYIGVRPAEIDSICLNKQGMTNVSYIVKLEDRSYVVRFPGKGTKKLINRFQEDLVYKALQKSNTEFCNDVVYFNPDTGIKISKFIDSSRVCNPYDKNDIKRCFNKLRGLHNLKVNLDFEFDIFDTLIFYESLREGIESRYPDYDKTKKNILSLKSFIDECKEPFVLSHIDSVSDNFLLTEDEVFLIDWEYSAMQDPHLDIAMFCIYNKYSKKQVDEIVDIYFGEGGCPRNICTKIYAYIAICGLIWSNWCEYKNKLGASFGEYAKNQYYYAKDYFEIVKNEV